jgi:DNA-directed RNA polymerase specialized sigma24 family protein
MSTSPANLCWSRSRAAVTSSPELRPLQIDQTQPAAKDDPTADALKAVLQSCRRRVRSWRVPPKYSRDDWFEEIEATQALAAWQAACAYDPSSGIKYKAFVYQKVMAGALTRYRQEWSYALRFISTDECAICTSLSNGAFDSDGSADSGGTPSWCPPVNIACPIAEDLDAALTALSKAERDLIQALFLHECSEAEIGRALGISQRAVSKRKHAILKLLRDQLLSESRRLGANLALGTAH